MSTVGAVIDRLFRTYLEPPNHQPATARLASDYTAGDPTLELTDFAVPEDEELVRNGVHLEVNAEIFEVTSYDELSSTATVNLEDDSKMGTTATSHSEGARVKLAPPFARMSVFESVADNIITLYPRLYQVTTAEVVAVHGGVCPIDDPLAVEVVEAWTEGWEGTTDIDARIVDYHPHTGGRALVANLQVGDVWVKYRKRFGDAASEADTLAALGVEPRWVRIVMVGACADLMAGRDLPASHTDWVEQVLEAENIPVGTRGSIAQRCAQYKEYLIEDAKKEMRAEYRAKTHMRPSVQVRTRSPFG